MNPKKSFTVTAPRAAASRSVNLERSGRLDRQSHHLCVKALVILLLICTGRIYAAEVVTYFYTNPQGTVLATADAGGRILNSMDYRPYGALALGSIEEGPGYSGHINDTDSGFIYMQARYYDPYVGRFLSVDPLGIQEAKIFISNDYAYAENNPIVKWDPFGLCAADLDDPVCPRDEQYGSGGQQGDPKKNNPSQPSTQDATPLPGMIVTGAKTHAAGMGALPPPIFRAPEGRAIFSRTITRVLLEKADDAASNAVVKKLSFRMLGISKKGFLTPTPVSFGLFALFHIDSLGGCDGKGHCSDEAPVSSLRSSPLDGETQNNKYP